MQLTTRAETGGSPFFPLPRGALGCRARGGHKGFKDSQGLGVPKDYVQAYVWYTLAVGQGDDLAGKLKDHLEKSMTLDQLAKAEMLEAKGLMRMR